MGEIVEGPEDWPQRSSMFSPGDRVEIEKGESHERDSNIPAWHDGGLLAISHRAGLVPARCAGLR